MKFIFFKLLLILQFFTLNSLQSETTYQPFNKLNNNIGIKVLLGEINLSDDMKWEISSNKGIILKNKEGKKILFNQSVEIKTDQKNFYLNNKKIVRKRLKIHPVEGYLKFNNKEYQGDFFIIKENNSLLFINEIELENYIYSVLNTESWPGWPLEVNKAFAIASRSYVIAKYLEQKDKKPIYHVKNTNKHQTYYGVHGSDLLKQATEETKGIILGYKKKPILAMFDACCGGVIPAHINGVNFKHAPYLERKEACKFCKSCKLYSWKIEYKRDEFEKILKNEFPKLNNLQSINIIKDKAGVAQKIEVKSNKKAKYSVTGKKFYSLFNKIKSFCFSANKSPEKITIKGIGYGHHLGICQWGAREMVNQGWDYKSILKFYYPGISFMKLYKNS